VIGSVLALAAALHGEMGDRRSSDFKVRRLQARPQLEQIFRISSVRQREGDACELHNRRDTVLIKENNRAPCPEMRVGAQVLLRHHFECTLEVVDVRHFTWINRYIYKGAISNFYLALPLHIFDEARKVEWVIPAKNLYASEDVVSRGISNILACCRHADIDKAFAVDERPFHDEPRVRHSRPELLKKQLAVKLVGPDGCLGGPLRSLCRPLGDFQRVSRLLSGPHVEPVLEVTQQRQKEREADDRPIWQRTWAYYGAGVALLFAGLWGVRRAPDTSVRRELLSACAFVTGGLLLLLGVVSG